MRSAKQHIKPIDMELISQAYKSAWSTLNQNNRLTDPGKAAEVRDTLTRKLVQVAQEQVAKEGVIDVETLRNWVLAEIPR